MKYAILWFIHLFIGDSLCLFRCGRFTFTPLFTKQLRLCATCCRWKQAAPGQSSDPARPVGPADKPAALNDERPLRITANSSKKLAGPMTCTSKETHTRSGRPRTKPLTRTLEVEPQLWRRRRPTQNVLYRAKRMLAALTNDSFLLGTNNVGSFPSPV